MTPVRAETTWLTLIFASILLTMALLMAGIGLKDHIGTCPQHQVDPTWPTPSAA
jgi:hypothetical protein